jgi:O-antigen/teichoic acid export membrane protein
MTNPSGVRLRAWMLLERFGIWGALDQIVLAGSGFLVAAIVARTGGPDALGLFALVQGMSLLLVGLFKAAVGDPLVIEAHRHNRVDGLSVGLSVTLFHTGLGLILSLCWVLVAKRMPIGMLGSHSMTPMVVALLPLVSFHELARSFRLAGLDERHLFVGDLWVATARLGSLALGFAGVRGLDLGLLALAAGGIVSILTIQMYIRDVRGIAHISRLWQLGRWIAIESLLYGIATYGIWLLVVPRAGLSAAGELRAGLQLFAPMQTILIGLNTIFLGRLARAQVSPKRVQDARMLEIGLTGAWGGLMAGLGPRAVSIVFGDAFQLPRVHILALTALVMATTGFEFAALRLRAAGRIPSLLRARGAATASALAAAALWGTSFLGVVIAIFVSQVIGSIAVRRYGWNRTAVR